MIRPLGTKLLIGLAILCLSNSAPAAPAWPVPRDVSHEPVPYHYDASQWKQVPTEYLDDAPACTLYAGTTYLVEAEGTVETIIHEVTRLNSRKAIEKLGEYHTIVYNPSYETLTLNEARVIKADGRTLPVEPKHLHLRDTVTDYRIYDPSKELVISFPMLETGDCIEVKWTTRGKNPEYQGQFFNRYTFGDDLYPVVCDEVRVRLPKTKPLKFSVTGGKLDQNITEEGEQRTYHWRAVNRAQLPLDDNLPPKEEMRLQVSMSTFSTWAEVFQWDLIVRKDCWEVTPEIRQVVQDVTKGLNTPLDKARALTYWLRRHVRYVSAGERHDYTPHKPAVVFDNLYGDCKDTSQLLAVMMKEAGVPVSVATLGVLDDGQVLPEVPSPWGTHAILMATIDGKEHWVDTTASLAGWDQLPHDDCDRLCCVIDDSGIRLVRTPQLSPANYRIDHTTNLAVQTDGSSRCERNVVYSGLAAMIRRYDWVDVPAGERRRLVTAELQDANSRSRLDTFQLDAAELADFDQPVHANVVFEVQGHFAEDSDSSGALEGAVSDSIVWNKLLAINLDYDRQVPLQLPAQFESIHRFAIQLPTGFVADSIPASRTIASKWGCFQVSVKADRNDPTHIEVTHRTKIDQILVQPADFEEFRKFRENIARAYRTWLAFVPVKEKVSDPPVTTQPSDGE
jgi:hypothetical protein